VTEAFRRGNFIVEADDTGFAVRSADGTVLVDGSYFFTEGFVTGHFVSRVRADMPDAEVRARHMRRVHHTTKTAFTADDVRRICTEYHSQRR
jgi:hypothetical protein